jgi:hypothetical protein
MFTSLLGIRLVLWAGATVPRPAPPDVLSSLVRLQVINDAQEGDSFQMTFSMARDQSLEYTLLRGGTLDQFNRVIVGVVMGALPIALIDGIITNHEVQPGDGTGASTLTVTGKDVSLMMDLTEESESHPNQPDSVITLKLIAKYAQYGLVPVVTPTTNVPIEVERTPRQHESDLRFIRRMAARNGFVTYVEPVTFGVNQFFWGPQTRAGIPQKALTKDLGAYTNLKSLTFQNDSLAPVGTSGTILEPITGLRLPLPSLPSLRLPPLSGSPASARRTHVLRESGRENAATAIIGAVAAATNAPDAVQGQGEVDSARYGAVLRARRPVGVRGAGLSYDGFYFVQKVTHIFTRGEYVQQFVISREGTGTLTPVVVP